MTPATALPRGVRAGYGMGSVATGASARSPASSRCASTLVALATDGTCDVFTIADEMRAAGWYVQPQLSHAGHAPTLHLTLSAATAAHVEEFLTALGDAVAVAVESGPVAVAPELEDLVRALDPATLTEQDFDGLLAGVGMGGSGSAVPERMAEVNALLDLAAPALREALLTAFLDRLSRPVRGGSV